MAAVLFVVLLVVAPLLDYLWDTAGAFNWLLWASGHERVSPLEQVGRFLLLVPFVVAGLWLAGGACRRANRP